MLRWSATRPLLPAVAAALVIGVGLGVGGFTVLYARGFSYLSNEAAACANCHVMQGHYDGWLRSSHRNVAVCNDCHTPAALGPKYLTKATNGWHHSVAFTSGRFHEPIQARPVSTAIVEENCRRCHAEITAAIEGPGSGGRISCVRCHGDVGHLR